jgi:hypothetical protein
MSVLLAKADIRQCEWNVRFGSKANMAKLLRHVRFAPESSLGSNYDSLLNAFVTPVLSGSVVASVTF